MRQELLKRAGLRALYQRELKSAFPSTELKPLRAMERLRSTGSYEPLAFYDEAGLAGYALLWLAGDTVLLDYFGVPAARRNGGLGSRILKALSACLEGRTMILEAEAPDGGAEDALRQRRIDFYARGGCQLLPYDCGLFGVRYRCMAMNWDGKDAQSIMDRHRQLYQRNIPRRFYEGNVRIPLPAGEKPPSTMPWNEI